jgi:hypothetical protein
MAGKSYFFTDAQSAGYDLQALQESHLDWTNQTLLHRKPIQQQTIARSTIPHLFWVFCSSGACGLGA